MGCIPVVLAFLSPRLALFAVWLLTDLLGRAFDGWIVPVLGFFLLPWTTLSYVAFWDWGAGTGVAGIEWFFVVLAFLVDLGAIGGGAKRRS